MAKKIISFSIVFSLLFITSPALAAPARVTAYLDTPGTERILLLPPQAAHSPVISLGQVLDLDTGKLVEGYAFIHYKENEARPAKPPRGGSTQCYGFLSKGAQWKTNESWLVNPTNSRGLSANFILNNLTFSIGKWEDAADGVMGNGQSIDILGNGALTNEILVADEEAPDNQNEVYFADISTPNAIAVTIVWGIFSGPPSGRGLIEWDQVYDDVDYDWSMSGEAGKMDFENINTHELGHSVGLNDQYETACLEATMYGYANYGETKKRSLETPDILGVSTLY